ncbi:MAG: hypothetical protein WCS31_14795 [Verrucomicrobiae bacterium]
MSAAQAGDILRGGATAGAGRLSPSMPCARCRPPHARPRAAASPGLVPWGLERLTGGTWIGVNTPVQSGNNVNIKQTASQALLDWKTFNVGSGTTVAFDQSAGSSSTTNSARSPQLGILDSSSAAVYDSARDFRRPSSLANPILMSVR